MWYIRMVEFREAKAGDYGAMAEALALDPFWASYGVTGERIHHLLKQALTQGSVWVAGNGFGWVWYLDKGGFERAGYIRLLAVHPEHQGKGVGPFLVSQLESQVKGKTPGLFVLASDHNPRAQRLYAKLGYREVGRIPDFVLPGVEEVVFWKPLGLT